MLAIRQLVPSSVVHIACPLILEDGTSVVLAAVASSLQIRQTIFNKDNNSDTRCTFTPAKDEIHLGSVAVAVVACAHQCFVVLTQDNEIVVGRYQANLAVPKGSWLADDILHHNNSWIILYRGVLSTTRLGSRSMPSSKPLLVSGARGNIIQCSIIRGWRHTICIDIPENVPESYFREKWILNFPQSVNPYSCNIASFKRDVVEQADEELLMQYTVAELAERKRTQFPTSITQSIGKPPIGVTVLFASADDNVVSIALMPVLNYNRRDSFIFVSTVGPSLNVYEAFHPPFRGKMLGSLCVSGSPYFLLTLPGRILVFSLLSGVHVLSVLSSSRPPLGNMLDDVRNHGVLRLARSILKPISGIVVQRKGCEEILWLLLDNGLLAKVSIEIFNANNNDSIMMDAPNILSGDCEDFEWHIEYINGLPRDFRATSFLPYHHHRCSTFEPYPITKRYAILSDGVADIYIIDLIERRLVGGIISNGAMTSACSGPDMSIIISYTKGVLQRISPGIISPIRVYTEFTGIREIYSLPHMNSVKSVTLSFHFLITTATRTVILRGSTKNFEELYDVQDFILDEPTLAIHSKRKRLTTVKSSLYFVQCTTHFINIEGIRIPFLDLLPEMDNISHASFISDNFNISNDSVDVNIIENGELLAVADGKRVAILFITIDKGPYIFLQEHLPGEVSHLITWCNFDKRYWGVAACLWSNEIVIWMQSIPYGKITRRHVLPLSTVVLSSFKIPSNNNNNNNNNNCVGLTLMNGTTAVLCCESFEEIPVLKIIEDIDYGVGFRADCGIPVTTFGLGTSNPHFNLVTLREEVVNLVSLNTSNTVVEEKLRLELSLPSCSNNDSKYIGNPIIINNKKCNMDSNKCVNSAIKAITPHCGIVLYLPMQSFYLLLLSDGKSLALWSFPELLSSNTNINTNTTPTQEEKQQQEHKHRSNALLRGPVHYQITHHMKLPSITAHDHSLTKVIYMPMFNTIVALADRGEEISLITTIDADTFHVIDGLAMMPREIPTCMETLHAANNNNNNNNNTEAFVVGTAMQSLGLESEPTSGRLLIAHVRPLRISAAAHINGSAAFDISVQGRGDEYIIVVASLDRVLVYRLTGLTLELSCVADTKSACTTVALRYPFISCGLHAWGTQYMQLLPEGGDVGNILGESMITSVLSAGGGHNDDITNSRHNSSCCVFCRDRNNNNNNNNTTTNNNNNNNNNNNSITTSVEFTCSRSDNTLWPRWRGVAFTLKSCVLEPTAFAGVHGQITNNDNFIRIDGDRNVMSVIFRDPQEPISGELTSSRVVGVDGGYCSALTRCLRLPATPRRIAVSNNNNNNNNNIRISSNTNSNSGATCCCHNNNSNNINNYNYNYQQPHTPWRHRRPRFVNWCERLSLLRLVGPLILISCNDGSLYAAAELPQAFASPLLRLEQKITELYDTTLALTSITDNNNNNINNNNYMSGTGLRRTYHAVSFEAEWALQSITRVLRKQGFLCVDAIEEYFTLTRLTAWPPLSNYNYNYNSSNSNSSQLSSSLLSTTEAALVLKKKSLLDEFLTSLWQEYGGELHDIDLGDLLHLW